MGTILGICSDESLKLISNGFLGGGLSLPFGFCSSFKMLLHSFGNGRWVVVDVPDRFSHAQIPVAFGFSTMW